MRQSFLAGSKALFFVALTTLSVQADFNGVSNTNNVSVNTEVEAPFFQEGFESTAIASFTASPDSIMEGESTTISWSTINTASCTPSGDLEEWNNSTLEVPLEVPSGQVPITVSTAGNYLLTLTCDNGIENQDVKTISVTVTEPVIILISEADFVATPDSIIEGESTTISWNIENAISCTPSGDLEEWNNSTLEVPSGELPITISTPGTYSLTLTCESETGNQGTATIPVTVTEHDCTSTLVDGTEYLWTDVFRLDWPGPKSEQTRIRVPRYSYTSVEFYTGQVEDTGKFLNIEASAVVGSRLGAISKCPGDFNVVPECRFISHTYAGEGIIWATTGADGYCQLEKDTTYYWNITFTDGVERTSSECVGTFCYTWLRNVNLDYVE